MRIGFSLPILACISLSSTVLAQNQVPVGSSTPSPSASPTPLTLKDQVDKYVGIGKRLVQVYLGNTPIDFEARDESDRAAGVVRLTDENWDREMTAWDGDWAIVLHGNLHGLSAQDPASTFFIQMHDNATSLAQSYISSPPLEKDGEQKLSNLKKVKWARFDYITEWEWCARYMVTRPPWLVFVTNHGQDVRFLGTRSISAEGRKLFSFMAFREWEKLNIWKPIPFYTRCAEFYIKANHQVGLLTANIPRWVWLFVVPAATQGLVKYIFFGSPTTPAPAQGGARPVPAARKNA